MKKITAFVFFVFIIASCSVKQSQNQLSSGDYDDAITTSVNSLRNNKDKKRKQEHILLLEDAFAKAKERDERSINLLAKDANPVNLEKIYNIFQLMNNRQELIRPLLPLRLIADNREAQFKFEDYSDQIVSSKNALSTYLYNNALNAVMLGSKAQNRQAYDDLLYLNQINPNFKDVKKLTADARMKGSDYVNVTTKNETGLIIPQRLQNDLLNFGTFGLNDQWTVYHSSRQNNVKYDYGVVINFRSINISPEQIKEKEFSNEKLIKIGTKKLLDTRGNVVKDSLGNAILVDNMKTVKLRINEFRQFKACQVVAQVEYVNLHENNVMRTFPLASEFVFENIYATATGDRRAATENYSYLNNKPIPFPSNEQMVYDTGEDLKAKLKTIIINNRINKQ